MYKALQSTFAGPVLGDSYPLVSRRIVGVCRVAYLLLHNARLQPNAEERNTAMTRRFKIAAHVLVGMLVLSSRLAHSTDSVGSLATQADLDSAIAKTLGQEDAARRTITTLLQREDVRSMAGSYGLDVRRAEAAVSTLQGEELQRLSLLAANADAQLAGGTQTITISLVALLLIVIIIILLV